MVVYVYLCIDCYIFFLCGCGVSSVFFNIIVCNLLKLVHF